MIISGLSVLALVGYVMTLDRTVGLVVAVGLGAMLAFLLASGFEREDAPAAAALAVGVIAGLLLAHVGIGLRDTQQRYPRDYSPSPDTPE